MLLGVIGGRPLGHPLGLVSCASAEASSWRFRLSTCSSSLEMPTNAAGGAVIETSYRAA